MGTLPPPGHRRGRQRAAGARADGRAHRAGGRRLLRSGRVLGLRGRQVAAVARLRRTGVPARRPLRPGRGGGRGERILLPDPAPAGPRHRPGSDAPGPGDGRWPGRAGAPAPAAATSAPARPRPSAPGWPAPPRRSRSRSPRRPCPRCGWLAGAGEPAPHRRRKHHREGTEDAGSRWAIPARRRTDRRGHALVGAVRHRHPGADRGRGGHRGAGRRLGAGAAGSLAGDGDEPGSPRGSHGGERP